MSHLPIQESSELLMHQKLMITAILERNPLFVGSLEPMSITLSLEKRWSYQNLVL
jgi:hypothetical protein